MKIFNDKKKLTWVIILTSSLGILYSGCRKQFGFESDNLNELVASSKEWFQNKVVENEKARISQNTPRVIMNVFDRRFARMGNLSKMSVWKDAIVYKIDQLDFVVVAIEESVKPFKNQNYEAIRRLIFYQDASGKMKMNVIEIISKKGAFLGDVNNLVKTALNNKYFGRKNTVPNTNATVFFYNERYWKEDSYRVNDGQWSSSKDLVANVKGATAIRKINTMARTTTCQTCETWYTVGFWYDQNTGQVVYWEILNEYEMCTDSYPPYGGGGSTDPNQTNECVDNCTTVVNELSNAQTSSETVSVAIVDINGLTKYKKPKWKILTNVTWSLHSQEEGIVELVDVETNKWVWKELNHPANAITKEGTTPGGVVTWTNGTGTPSFTPGSPNILYGGMSLTFNVTYQPVCDCPGIQNIIPAYSASYTSNGIWDAKPQN